MLSDYCDDRLTDKNSIHSYIDLYQELFASKRETATHVLEVGIGPKEHLNGGSISMWTDFFYKAEVHAVDIINIDKVNPNLIGHPRIHLHTSNDAYNVNFFKNTFLSKKHMFDIVLDDGPHTLESMLVFLKLYSRLMKPNGILAIEDVQDIEWIDKLREATPKALLPYVETYDRRDVKGRYDDIVFVINKNKVLPPN
jgi:cephalosporin hydroxylase